MEVIWTYLVGVLLEGLLIGFAFWLITYMTLEISSLRGALRAGLISEAIGNVPYLAGMGPLDLPALIMTLIAGVVFVRVILRVGELSISKVLFGLMMTYFFLVALVACGPLD
jgi:hypothetical protein